LFQPKGASVLVDVAAAAPAPGQSAADLGARIATDDLSELEVRILEAAHRCVARWGVSKTTLDDIAREAGCSRATVYRAVPGGKQAVFLAGVALLERRFHAGIEARLRDDSSLEDLVVDIVTSGARFLAHDEAFRYLCAHEPETVLPHLAFDGLEPLLRREASVFAPHLARFLDPEVAWRTAEWLVQIVVHYVLDAAPIDLTDEAAARRFVTTYVLPGLTLHGSAANPAPAGA
jgi:AcrR family transcriptional regulator